MPTPRRNGALPPDGHPRNGIGEVEEVCSAGASTLQTRIPRTPTASGEGRSPSGGVPPSISVSPRQQFLSPQVGSSSGRALKSPLARRGVSFEVTDLPPLDEDVSLLDDGMQTNIQGGCGGSVDPVMPFVPHVDGDSAAAVVTGDAFSHPQQQQQQPSSRASSLKGELNTSSSGAIGRWVSEELLGAAGPLVVAQSCVGAASTSYEWDTERHHSASQPLQHHQQQNTSSGESFSSSGGGGEIRKEPSTVSSSSRRPPRLHTNNSLSGTPYAGTLMDGAPPPTVMTAIDVSGGGGGGLVVSMVAASTTTTTTTTSMLSPRRNPLQIPALSSVSDAPLSSTSGPRTPMLRLTSPRALEELAPQFQLAGGARTASGGGVLPFTQRNIAETSQSSEGADGAITMTAPPPAPGNQQDFMIPPALQLQHRGSSGSNNNRPTGFNAVNRSGTSSGGDHRRSNNNLLLPSVAVSVTSGDAPSMPHQLQERRSSGDIERNGNDGSTDDETLSSTGSDKNEGQQAKRNNTTNINNEDLTDTAETLKQVRSVTHERHSLRHGAIRSGKLLSVVLLLLCLSGVVVVSIVIPSLFSASDEAQVTARDASRSAELRGSLALSLSRVHSLHQDLFFVYGIARDFVNNPSPPSLLSTSSDNVTARLVVGANVSTRWFPTVNASSTNKSSSSSQSALDRVCSMLYGGVVSVVVYNVTGFPLLQLFCYQQVQVHAVGGEDEEFSVVGFGSSAVSSLSFNVSSIPSDADDVRQLDPATFVTESTTTSSSTTAGAAAAATVYSSVCGVTIASAAMNALQHTDRGIIFVKNTAHHSVFCVYDTMMNNNQSANASSLSVAVAVDRNAVKAFLHLFAAAARGIDVLLTSATAVVRGDIVDTQLISNSSSSGSVSGSSSTTADSCKSNNNMRTTLTRQSSYVVGMTVTLIGWEQEANGGLQQCSIICSGGGWDSTAVCNRSGLTSWLLVARSSVSDVTPSGCGVVPSPLLPSLSHRAYPLAVVSLILFIMCIFVTLFTMVSVAVPLFLLHQRIESIVSGVPASFTRLEALVCHFVTVRSLSLPELAVIQDMFQVLCACFAVNQKYVPDFVLAQQQRRLAQPSVLSSIIEELPWDPIAARERGGETFERIGVDEEPDADAILNDHYGGGGGEGDDDRTIYPTFEAASESEGGLVQLNTSQFLPQSNRGGGGGAQRSSIVNPLTSPSLSAVARLPVVAGGGGVRRESALVLSMTSLGASAALRNNNNNNNVGGGGGNSIFVPLTAVASEARSLLPVVSQGSKLFPASQSNSSATGVHPQQNLESLHGGGPPSVSSIAGEFFAGGDGPTPAQAFSDMSQTALSLPHPGVGSGNRLSVVSGGNNAGTTVVAAGGGGISVLTQNMILQENATLLVVYMEAVEAAYRSDFYVTEVQHRKVLAALHSVIRRHRGEVFERTGDRVSVAWNAFDARSDHALRAVRCAMDIASLFRQFRRDGLRMGIVVHQGPVVCGVVGDRREAASVLFGQTADQAVRIAALAAQLPYFNVVVTEPVKQAVSIFFECVIVDVVRDRENDVPLMLFDIRPSDEHAAGATTVASPGPDVGGLRSVLPATTTKSSFVVQYSVAFAHFRAHEFQNALEVLSVLQNAYPMDPLVLRLAYMCLYYSEHEEELPQPYMRSGPEWQLFEQRADPNLSGGSSMAESLSRFAEDLVHKMGEATAKFKVFERTNSDERANSIHAFQKELQDHHNASTVVAGGTSPRNASSSATPLAAAAVVVGGRIHSHHHHHPQRTGLMNRSATESNVSSLLSGAVEDVSNIVVNNTRGTRGNSPNPNAGGGGGAAAAAGGTATTVDMSGSSSQTSCEGGGGTVTAIGSPPPLLPSGGGGDELQSVLSVMSGDQPRSVSQGNLLGQGGGGGPSLGQLKHQSFGDDDDAQRRVSSNSQQMQRATPKTTTTGPPGAVHDAYVSLMDERRKPSQPLATPTSTSVVVSEQQQRSRSEDTTTTTTNNNSSVHSSYGMPTPHSNKLLVEHESSVLRCTTTTESHRVTAGGNGYGGESPKSNNNNNNNNSSCVPTDDIHHATTDAGANTASMVALMESSGAKNMSMSSDLLADSGKRRPAVAVGGNGVNDDVAAAAAEQPGGAVARISCNSEAIQLAVLPTTTTTLENNAAVDALPVPPSVAATADEQTPVVLVSGPPYTNLESLATPPPSQLPLTPFTPPVPPLAMPTTTSSSIAASTTQHNGSDSISGSTSGLHLAAQSNSLLRRTLIESVVWSQGVPVGGAGSASVGGSQGSVNANAKALANDLPTTILSATGTSFVRSSRILGTGSFGCVYMGMEQHTSRLVAMKFLPLPSDEAEVRVLQNEVVTMETVTDANLVEFYGYAFVDNMIVLMMECMVAGSLASMLSTFATLPEQTTINFMRDVLRGLHRLHSMGIVHRDVKPQNVLIAANGHCKISDFGASASIHELVRRHDGGAEVQGTPIYLAPEAARGHAEPKSDVWSVGIMYLQLTTGKIPYDASVVTASIGQVVFGIGSGRMRPVIPADLSPLARAFVEGCLADDPTKRLTATALLALPFFSFVTEVGTQWV